eukprot:IDg22021t1
MFPSRPKFSWDIRNVPWTDGKGSQDEYARSVSLWRKVHDMLPDTNANKIPAKLQGIMLQSQLFGRARDLCKSIPEKLLQSEQGVDEIVNAIHKRDALAVVSEVYQDFIELLATRRGQSEKFGDFEFRFSAQVSKFNCHSDLTKLPEALTAFMLLSNSNVDANQRISVLAASSPTEKVFEKKSTTTDFIKSVSYESIASVIRQCESPKTISSTLNSSAASNVQSRGKKFRTRLSPEKLAELKLRSKCNLCSEFGHWSTDHNPDGSLKPGVVSRSKPSQKQANSKKAISFNMVNLSSKESQNVDEKRGCLGPLLDDGAPYSGIGINEFKLIQPFVLPNWSGKLDAIPESVADRPYWQYGTGSHSSELRKIIGSLVLNAISDQGDSVEVRHLVIDGSSQWVIGRNVTRFCDIIHVGENLIRFSNKSITGSISLIENDFHSYLPYKIFIAQFNGTRNPNTAMFCATAKFKQSKNTELWSTKKKVIDKVHRHVCGHSSFNDIKILLERNGMWCSSVQKYLCSVLETCSYCKTTSEPKPSRKVSLSSMSRTFNKVVCIDHLFLRENRVFHAMDSTTRYSAGTDVQDMSMLASIVAFESQWISQFWIPETVLADKAFDNDMFKSFTSKYGIKLKILPPRRHSKNVIESKHKVIRDIYLRLKAENEAEEEMADQLFVQQALRISNDLYGNDVMSAHELAKGFSRPATKDIFVSPGDLVQIHVKLQNQKKGKWSSNKPVLSYDHDSRTVTVPGSKGKTVQAAIEDVRPALSNDILVNEVQESLDIMNNEIEDALSEMISSSVETETTLYNDEHCSDDDDPPFLTQGHDMPKIGEHIEVFWPEDDKYYEGCVSGHDEKSDTYKISYCDGDLENLKLQDEKWRFVANPMSSNEVQLHSTKVLPSIESESIDLYYEVFRSKEFMLHQSQGLPSYVTQNAFEKEEKSFKKTVREVHVQNVPSNANVISSHVIYKVKILDDGSKLMKARIAPHGNKDRDKHSLKSDSSMCSPLAAYGLVNAGAKWQEHIEKTLKSIGFMQVILIPQLFYLRDDSGDISVIAAKVVDDILFVGDILHLKSAIRKLQAKYEIGTIVYGPGTFLFNGLVVSQDEDFSIAVHADFNISISFSKWITRWIGTAASPFCAFASSYLQQKVSNVKVRDLITQINMTRKLKSLGTAIKFKRPMDSKKYDVSIVTFSDASRSNESGQIAYISGLLIGDLQMGSIFHTLSWTSHKSKRPVRSIGSAEIIAAGGAIDEGKLIAKAFEILLSFQIDYHAVLDSKDLWDSLSTCHTPLDKSIRADVSVIRYEFETHNVNKMTWIPGKCNLSDPLTKPNSPLVKSLQLMLFEGEISIQLDEAKTRDSQMSTG